MKLKLLFLTLLLFSFCKLHYSQWINQDFIDHTQEIAQNSFTTDSYYLSGNPAWLILEKYKDATILNSFYSTKSGEYRRRFSEKRNNFLKVGASIIKNLKSAGVFYGRFNYNYEKRKDNYQILTKRTYTGNPFYLRDNTTGDMKYTGPAMSLLYSLNLLKQLSFGLQVDYAVDNGLKEVFTYAESVNRDVNLKGGFVYKPETDLKLGMHYSFNSYQEKLMMQDVNNRSVEVYRHRGDNFSVRSVSSQEEEKIKTKEHIFSSFNELKLHERLNIKLQLAYFWGDTRILVPASLIIDNEDGKELYSAGSLNLINEIDLGKNLSLDLRYSLYCKKSRSQNSIQQYLLWNWSLIEHTFGGRLFFDNLPGESVVGIESGVSVTISDSSKYIDNKYSKERSVDFFAGTFGKIKLSDKMILKYFYKYSFLEKDHFYSFEDVSYHKIYFELKYKYSELISLMPYFSYATNRADKENEKTLLGIKMYVNLN